MTPRDALIERADAAFRNSYGCAPSRIVAAPGRVNLIGEHCDYNDGLVLPCAIDRETVIAIGKGAGSVRAVAADFDGDLDSFNPVKPIARVDKDWKNHIRGVAHFLLEQGVTLEPVNMAIAGNLPIGAGLSSSASLGVATALALSEWNDADIKPSDLAHIAQRTENDFVGCACGIMDQMASACSQASAALLLDCRTLEYQPVTIPGDVTITIIDSGIRRNLTNSPFNARRAECQATARHYGVSALRDLDLNTLAARRADLEDMLFRRARHVVSEIARVKETVRALATSDLAKLGQLMQASHNSLRDDFEVSIPPIDALATGIEAEIADQGGIRMTGAGFGGCLVALTSEAASHHIIEWVNRMDHASTDPKVSARAYSPSKGAHRII